MVGELRRRVGEPLHQRDGLAGLQSSLLPHDTQTEVPSWALRPKTLGGKSPAELGILQNLSRMRSAEPYAPGGGQAVFS